ncbi:hypothetical protein Daura_28045 [Dactylosporangium aurantiacum]|uniref:Uncharacterized protein n=1 Tax=Dactylosporangium aurantiacum TaxID=35754 RepID=A0A9Q9I7P9_9ACTN|nr:hypothetical protein [Dactylosporangium aurantiacum]MDG6106970.1 hypothetical protein [Dactylosporangium aurantiacum]UWZ50671.1 hypothetical protein Daura_28045 [Dactylosporangium aurantiacum]
MQLRGVETADRTMATLWFTGDGVYLVRHSARQAVLLRRAGGTAFAALAVALTATGVGSAVNGRAGGILFAGAGILAVAAAATAVAGWVLSRRHARAIREAAAAPDLPLAGMVWARSTDEGERRRVTVGMTGGEVHEFTAAGMTGIDLVRQFGALLRPDGALDGR